MKLIKMEKEFIKESNAIEGLYYPYRCYDNGEVNIPEISNHREAFIYMKNNCGKNLTHKRILTMHGILMDGLLDDKYTGKYRTCNVRIGDSFGYLPIQIRPAMDNLIKMAKRVKTEEEVWNVHNEFEVIHPFADGNGRTGRLILNWLNLKIGLPLEIVLSDNRQEYYNKINSYRIKKQIMEFQNRR